MKLVLPSLVLLCFSLFWGNVEATTSLKVAPSGSVEGHDAGVATCDAVINTPEVGHKTINKQGTVGSIML